MERTATALLRWSRWRRWHQAWARYYHYRRRGSVLPPLPESPAAAERTALTEVVWRRLEGLLPPAKRIGRPYAHDRRVVLEAILYVMHAGGGWRELPDQYPPWQTVYAQLCRWKALGIWDQIWTGLPGSELVS